MTRGLALALALAAPLLTFACKRKPANEASDASSEVAAAESANVDAEAPKLAPARCKVDDGGWTLGAGGDDVEIGEAVALPSGIAVGLLRKVNGATVASVAIVPPSPGAPTFVDLGPPLGDASPPKPFARGGELFAAYFPRPTPPLVKLKSMPPAPRELSIVRIDGGKAQAPLAVPQQRDESLAFDVVATDKGALVAWDEDFVGNERGAIKIATIAPDGKAIVSTRVASPESSDAETPRVVARKNGYWLVWVATRPEAPRDAAPDPSYALERPGRDRAYRWLEMLPLDDRGEATGPARKLTSERGHVALFDLAPRADANVLDLVAQADEQLLRITVKGDAPEPPIAITADALGRGAPDLLTSAEASWLSFDDASDKLRLVPLDATRSPAGLPSVEEALDRARPLVATNVAPKALDVIAAFPAEAQAQLRRVRCANEAR